MRNVLPCCFARAALICIATFVLPTLQAAAPTETPPLVVNSANELARAMALSQTGKFAEAAVILEAVTRREPRNPMAWAAFGDACLHVDRVDEALSAYRKVLDIEPASARAMYGIGVGYAKKQQPDDAFAWLGKAKATRKLDMTAIQVDADLAKLQPDPRFAKLLPKPADFANPFVEKVKIIREWDGEAINDQFGWIARGIGDVDGDGIADIVTSAPTKNVGGDNAGRVYVYSTHSGKLIWSVDGKPEDQLGSGLDAAGDTDGDGIGDVIASAPYIDKAYVYSGKDGHVLLTFEGEAKGDNFGNHVSGAGDLDHDGHADVIIGAPMNNAGGKGAGRAYVYSGKDGHRMLTLTGEHEGDGFGSAVTGYADDKNIFLVVTAPTAGPRKTGRVYVYDGLSQTPKFTFDADESGRALGYMFTSVLGDVDGDGVPDIFVSDFADASKGPSTGRGYVYSGKTGQRLLTLSGQTAREGFGTTHSIAGDVDHDGHADLIVGAWQYAGVAASGGRAYLYSGKNGSLLKTYTCRIPGDTFGFDAVAIGDVDGDGDSDLLITSAWSGVHGFHSGRVFLIASGVGGASH